MENELSKLDLDALKRMHESASFKMQSALLHGASWAEVKQQRELVVELAVAIHKRHPGYFLGPAESAQNRNESRKQGPSKPEIS